MKFLECMIAWDGVKKTAEVGPWPDRTGWSRPYRMTDGACNGRYHKFSPEMITARAFIIFNTMVVREKIPVDVAHKAMLAIDEYRYMISPDIPGAEDPPEES